MFMQPGIRIQHTGCENILEILKMNSLKHEELPPTMLFSSNYSTT